MKTSRIPLFFGLLAAIVLTSSAIQADTVFYYRFGNNPNTPGSLTGATTGPALTNSGVTAITLPESGAGSAFLDPIDGQTNTRAAEFDAVGDRLTGASGQLSLGSAFTIEAMANLSAYATSTRMIASQWITASPQRSWFFGIGADERLRLTISGNGTNSTLFDSGLTFSLNTDYYVAAVFSSGEVTFYMQNLTLGTAMEMVTVTPLGAPTSVFNSTGSFQIGNYDASATHVNAWRGLLDEVRLSNTALTADLLLVPEPGSIGLLLGSGALLLLARRKKSRA